MRHTNGDMHMAFLVGKCKMKACRTSGRVRACANGREGGEGGAWGLNRLSGPEKHSAHGAEEKGEGKSGTGDSSSCSKRVVCLHRISLHIIIPRRHTMHSRELRRALGSRRRRRCRRSSVC